MLLINGAVRYLILFLAFALIFYFEGGHILRLTDPKVIGVQFAVFGIAMAFYMQTLNPRTEAEIHQTRFAGRAGLILSIFIPVILGFVEYCGHLFKFSALIVFISVAVLSVLHSTFIYYSFFHWAHSPQAFEGIATSQRFLQIRSKRSVWRALWWGCNFLFCGAGILMFAGFVTLAFGTGIGALFYSAKEELVEEIKSESYKTIDKKMDEIEAKYAADNCKIMPDNEMWEARDELREKQNRVDEEKIYKIYHGVE